MSRTSLAPLRRCVLTAWLAVIPARAGLAQGFELVPQSETPELHIAFSPDGRLYATLGECCGPLLLWETSSGRLLRKLRVPGNAHDDVVFSPDGRFVATTAVSLKHLNIGARWGEPPIVWNVATGALVTPLPASVPEIVAWGTARGDDAFRRIATLRDTVALISTDGRIAIQPTGTVDRRTISVLSLSSGTITAQLPGTYNTLRQLALSPDSRFLLVGWKPDEVEVWDLTSIQHVTTISQRFLTDAAVFSPDGAILALGSYATVGVYRTRDWTLTQTFATDSQPSYGNRELAFTPDGRRLAMSSDHLRILDLTTGTELPRPQAKVAGIDAWARGDSVIAIARSMKPRPRWARADATVELWSLGSGSPRLLGSEIYDVVSLAVSPDGRQVAAGLMASTIWSRYTKAYEGGYWHWDGATAASRVTTSPGDSTHEPVGDIAFSPSGRSLVTTSFTAIPTKRTCPYVACGEDEFTEYNVWLTRINLQTHNEATIVRLTQSGEIGPDVTLSEHGERVLVGSRKGLRVINGVSGARTAFVTLPADASYMDRCDDDSESGPVNRFSPSGVFAAIVTPGGVKIVNTVTGQTVRRLTLERDTSAVALLSARFDGDSAIMMLTCQPPQAATALQRVDVRTGQSRALVRFNESVKDVLPLSNGRFAAHVDGVVHLFDTRGERLGSFLLGTNGEWLVVAPDGRYDSSPRGTELAAWRSGATLVPVEQRDGAHRVPGLLGELFRR